MILHSYNPEISEWTLKNIVGKGENDGMKRAWEPPLSLFSTLSSKLSTKFSVIQANTNFPSSCLHYKTTTMKSSCMYL